MRPLVSTDFGVDEVMHVQLVRRLEEDAGMVLGFAFGSERGPGGVERGEAEGFGVIGFGFEPARDVIGESCAR